MWPDICTRQVRFQAGPTWTQDADLSVAGLTSGVMRKLDLRVWCVSLDAAAGGEHGGEAPLAREVGDIWYGVHVTTKRTSSLSPGRRARRASVLPYRCLSSHWPVSWALARWVLGEQITVSGP